MKLIETTTKAEMGAEAAKIFKDEITGKPDLILGLATGSSPIPLYDKLAELCSAGAVDFSRVSSYNLDEYVGLKGDHPQSYGYFMDTNLFSRIDINKDNTYLPDGCVDDLEAECKRYDKLIEDFGFADIQLLGIGPNGHIAFNEPSGMFTRNTSIVDLSESTIEANSRFFDDPSEVPRRAITMSIRHIMCASKIVLVANGNKKEIIGKAMNGEITPMIPASALQMHPDVTIIISKE